MVTPSCSNCKTLSKQCTELREEMILLHERLDKLAEIITCERHAIACQTDKIMKSDNSCQIESNHSEKACQTSSNCISSFTQTDIGFPMEVCEPLVSANPQFDALFNISIQANQIKDTQELNNLSQPKSPIISPYTFIPNQPFSKFDFNMLDKDIAFDHKMKNRSIHYFGDIPYTYGSVTHHPDPIPQSGNYLCKILGHVKNVLPEFIYNSVLVTRYDNGSQFIGYHSDNEPEIVVGSDILTLSFGETRVADFKCIDQFETQQTILLRHGDAFIMSRASQDKFQHTILEDTSLNPRISITLRLIKSKHETPVVTLPQSCPSQQSYSIAENSAPSLSPVIDTVYISDSMFRGMDGSKMSSLTHKAIVLTYPGATARGLISRLSNDPAFQKLDPTKVKKIYILCGSNNVDDILKVPRSLKSDFVDNSFEVSNTLLSQAKSEISHLATFLHDWATMAIINFINILPRVSYVRNVVINCLNLHIRELCNQSSYMGMILTELHRSLFSSKDGFRKNLYFVNKGGDNVHLNHQGIIRIAKYLKHFAHHD